jgi:hypothetical protein
MRLGRTAASCAALVLAAQATACYNPDFGSSVVTGVLVDVDEAVLYLEEPYLDRVTITATLRPNVAVGKVHSLTWSVTNNVVGEPGNSDVVGAPFLDYPQEFDGRGRATLDVSALNPGTTFVVVTVRDLDGNVFHAQTRVTVLRPPT